MAYYRYCPKHGCNLDPGEECEECERERERKAAWHREYMETVMLQKDGQARICPRRKVTA